MKGMKGINRKYILVGFVVVVTVVLLVVVTKQPKIKNSVKKGLKDNAPSVNTTQLNKPTETDAIGAMGGPAGGTGSNINIPNTQEGFSGFSGFIRGGAGQCFSGYDLNSESE